MGVFADKISGDAYINSALVSGAIINSSYVNGVYSFDVAAGSSVGNNYMSGLLSGNCSYEDLTGLITNYGFNAFEAAFQSTIKLGNGIVLGDDAFTNSNNITLEIGNFSHPFSPTFAISSTNSTFKFKGTIGSTVGDDNTFPATLGLVGSNNTFYSIIANQTSNSGGVEGDLAFLISNGATISFTL